MSKYILFASLVVLLASTLSGRSKAVVSGTIEEGETEIVHIFKVDFSDAAGLVTFTVEFTDARGMTVVLTDLQDLAGDGLEYAYSSNWGAVSDTVTVSHRTPIYDGTHYLSVEINGVSEYEGEIYTDDLPWGAITERGKVAIPNEPGTVDLLGRGKHMLVEFESARETVREMQIDLGTTPQNVKFWAHAQSWWDGGSVEIYEVDGSGTEQLLDTLQLAGNGSYAHTNVTTSFRSGLVTIRLKITSEGSGSARAEFILPSSATTDISPGGGDDDEGCTTGESRGWLMLLALLAVGAVAGRRLRQRA